MLLAGEGLQGVAGDVDALVFVLLAAALGAADVVVLDAIRAVVLRLNAERAGLQHHVEILATRIPSRWVSAT